jgi:DNA-binding protein HU-beta
MAKMTQTQTLTELSTKTGLSKKQVKDFITSLTDLAYREAKKGEFAIPGIGKLVKQKRKARIGRNPATGEEIKIPAKTVLKFRVAKAAKDAVLGAAKK